jgi:hypothetical protein
VCSMHVDMLEGKVVNGDALHAEDEVISRG